MEIITRKRTVWLTVLDEKSVSIPPMGHAGNFIGKMDKYFRIPHQMLRKI